MNTFFSMWLKWLFAGINILEEIRGNLSQPFPSLLPQDKLQFLTTKQPRKTISHELRTTMTLSPKELTSILSILSEEAVSGSSSFEAIANALHHYFGPNDYLRVGTALLMMFQHPDLLPDPNQRISVLFLFFEVSCTINTKILFKYK